MVIFFWEKTRVVGEKRRPNIATSDQIDHFEYIAHPRIVSAAPNNL